MEAQGLRDHGFQATLTVEWAQGRLEAGPDRLELRLLLDRLLGLERYLPLWDEPEVYRFPSACSGGRSP